jgi:putative hydrolase of the HAD superfamily
MLCAPMRHSPDYPQLIFVDAAGTLFQVRGSVGGIYAGIAARFNLTVPPAAIDEAFARLLPAHPPMVVGHNLEPTQHKQAEFDWWKRLAIQIFEPYQPIDDFDRLFEALFYEFTRPDAWHVFPDVIPALMVLKEKNIRLAVLSNFDSRLLAILDALNLTQYFEAVHFSTGIGYAKPDVRIFNAALSHHNLDPALVWHVGDSLHDDIAGAHRAGIRAIWLDRSAPANKNDQLERIARLDQLTDLLSKE